MPQVGAFIAGAVGFGAPAIGAATFGSWAAGAAFGSGILGSALIKLAGSVAISALSMALADKPQQPGIRAEVTQSGGVNPQSFVLGYYATGGAAVCPPMSYGVKQVGLDPKTPNEYLVFVVDLGDVPGGEFAGLIVDDVAVELGAAPERLANGGGFVTILTALGEVPDPDPNSWPEIGLPGLGDYAGKLWVKYKDGSDLVADHYLATVFKDYPERPWGADMIGRGVPYAIVTFKLDRELFRGMPQCRFVIGGIPLYDISKDSTAGGVGVQRWNDRATWQPSENAAVIAYNILRGIALPDGSTWGGGAPASALGAAEWLPQIARAAAAVDLGGGASEPRFRAGYEVRVDDEPASVLEQILLGSSGQVAEVGGAWRLRLGEPGLPVYMFTDDDVIIDAPQELDPFPGLDDTYNALHVSFPNPENLWQPTDAPPRYNAAWEAMDQGRRLPAALTMPATPYPFQVQRVGAAYIEDERRFLSHSVTLPPDARGLEPLDVVAWTSARNGYTAKLFEIQETQTDLMTGLCRVTMREVDPADHAPLSFYAAAVPASGIAPRSPAAVADVVAVPFVLAGAAGDARRPAVRVSWDAAQAAAFRALEWQIRLAGASESRGGTTQALAAGAIVISEGVLPVTAYEVRVRWVADQLVVWSDWLPVLTGDVRIGALDLAPAITGAIAAAQGDIAAAQALIAAEIEGRALTDLITLREADRAAAVTIGGLLLGHGEGEARRLELALLKEEVTAKVGENRALVVQETVARADADSVVAGRVTTLEATVNDAGTGLAATRAQVSAADTALANATGAVAGRVTTLEATVNDASTGLAATRAQVSAADTALANATGAVAGRVTTLEATVNDAGTGLAATRAQVSAADTALANATGAVAGRVTTLEATVNDASTGLAATRAQVSAADTALANATGAVAGRVTTLEATAGDLAAAVNIQQAAVATLEGNAEASFVLRTRAGGAVGEIEVVAADNPAGAASAVVIRSDRFTFAGDLAEFLGSVKIQGDLIAGGAVSRRAFISNWASKRVTATTLASAEQLGAVTSFNPAAYVGAADSPDNPTLISLSMALGPDGAAAGRISFALECDSGAGWSVRATQGVSFPSSWFGGYPVLRLVGSLAHGNLPFPAGSWRIRAYLQPGSPPVYVSSFVATIEQVNK